LILLYLSVTHLIAYPVSFIVGVVWSYVVNSRFVFRRRPTVRGFTAFPIVYLVQLLLGTAIVHFSITVAGIPAWAGPLIAIIITLPLTYSASRWLIRKTSPPLAHAPVDPANHSTKGPHVR
ncbi:GtrA family protein, partial [Lysobacter sp. D1-1-M9]|uniref:GtrA family protein n=1 Tax=Novilysobacter longmucuonensis TaxID=3098603 RepID=UPI002FC89E30